MLALADKNYTSCFQLEQSTDLDQYSDLFPHDLLSNWSRFALLYAVCLGTVWPGLPVFVAVSLIWVYTTQAVYLGTVLFAWLAVWLVSSMFAVGVWSRSTPFAWCSQIKLYIVRFAMAVWSESMLFALTVWSGSVYTACSGNLEPQTLINTI